MNVSIYISASDAVALTVAEVRARFRWKRMCMALLMLQDDLRVAREIASATPRKAKRW